MSYASLDKRRINGPDRVSQPIFRASESTATGGGAAAAGSAANGKGKSRQVEERSKRGDDGVRPICEFWREECSRLMRAPALLRRGAPRSPRHVS
jgi:hypothetical protein